MDCRRRSAVDDVRSRRWVVDDDRYPWEVDEDRRRRRSAIEEDRRRRRRAVDDDRRRRRWEVDDYPPLELPLKWRDPPPEYPPLELPLKWRNPLPDHLTCNQPTAVVRDSPLLRLQPVGPNFASASSRKQDRNSAHIPLPCPSSQSRYQIATKPTREISSACDTLDSDRLPLRSYNQISLLRAPPEPIDSLPPLTPPRPLSHDLRLPHTTSPKSSMIVPLPLRHANNESAPGNERDPAPGEERDLAPGIQPSHIACDFASDSSSLPIPDEATAAVIVQTHDFAPTLASSDDQNSDSDSLHEDSVAATPPLPPTQIELPLPLPFCSPDLAFDVEPDLSRAHSNSSSQRQFSDQKGGEDDSVDFYSGTAIAAAAYAIVLAEEGLLGKKKPIDEPGSSLTRSKSRREVCDDLLALSIAEMSINDVEVCGKATRSGIGNYFIAGVEMLGLNFTDKADPTQRSLVVRQNASEGFNPKFVNNGDEFKVTHGDSKCRSQAAHSQKQRGENFAIAEVINVELLMIRGVGTKNLRMLVDKEFCVISHLKQLSRGQFYGECSQKMVKFPENSQGIIHRNHVVNIVSFIKERVKQEGSLTQADLKRKLGNDKHLHKASAYFDPNNGGYIEIKEAQSESLQDDLNPNHEEVIKTIIRNLDINKDKKVSYEEFDATLKSNANGHETIVLFEADKTIFFAQVLHMDRNDYYGGESTSLNLIQILETDSSKVKENYATILRILCKHSKDMAYYGIPALLWLLNLLWVFKIFDPGGLTVMSTIPQ